MTSHQELSVLCGQSYRKSTFEEADIEVLVVGNVFVFRGTDEAKDVLRDLRILPLWTKELGWCPAGFVKAAKRLALKVVAVCLENDIYYKNIVLTGHSLGGAVAQIVGSLLKRDEIAVKEVVTFGAPRSGRLKILDAVPVTQYRHGKDIVPILGMCRRHNKLVEFGDRGSAIKDHYMVNYVKMQKLPSLK